MRINAIIWDYDGTLVDTRMKNFNVTKTIVPEITNGQQVDYPALNSLENYVQANSNSSNWRELYRNEFGFDEKQINYAGNLWTKYQLLDKTEVDLFQGIKDVISKQKPNPQGLLACISAIANLESNPSVVYVGDHQTDIQCAFNTNYELKRRAVASILINHTPGNSIEKWEYKPDHYAVNSKEIIEIVENKVL